MGMNLPMLIPSRGWAVYVLYDHEGHVLYVGSSRRVFARIGNHLTRKARAEAVGDVAIHQCSDESVMLALEREFIRDLAPRWNIRDLADRAESRRRAAIRPDVDPQIPPCIACGTGLSGVENDRPRNGRCQRCDAYRRRHGYDRPHRTA